MCSIQDRLYLFFVPESRDTCLFCLQNRDYLDGKQVHQKFGIFNTLGKKHHPGLVLQIFGITSRHSTNWATNSLTIKRDTTRDT